MAKIQIDPAIWVTGTQLAKEMGTTPQVVHNWRKRKLVQSQEFPEIGKILYKRGTVIVSKGKNKQI